jgi:long-chain acyl-CoA synthetase
MEQTLSFWALAKENPSALALVAPDGTELSARELLERSYQIVHGLRALGCTRGDAVGMVMENDADTLALALSTAQAGLYLIPINWHSAPAEIAYLLEDAEAKAIVCSPAHADLCADAADRSGLPLEARLCTTAIDGFRSFDAFVADQPKTEPADRCAGGIMNYTSGTTGKPKGVRRPLPASPPEPVAAMWAQFLFLFRIQPQTSGVHLVTSPLYHRAVLFWALSAAHLGHTVVLMDKWTAKGTMERIDRYKVTTTHMVPTQFNRLLAEEEALRPHYDVSSLRHVVHGAAPCPESTKRRMIDWWGEVIWEYYAATEGGGTNIDATTWLTKPGSVGQAWYGAEIRVYDDEGNACEPNEVGTVFMRMSHGGFDYHKDKKKTRDAFRPDGFFTVGDAGYLDEDGFLFLCDRKADMIISGGVNIYPAEIEGILMAHPAVADIAVFGIPDDDWGEQVHAIIELASGYPSVPQTTESILGHAREHLGGYKIPKGVDYIDTMPRDPNGKLKKRLLRDPFWEATGRAI